MNECHAADPQDPEWKTSMGLWFPGEKIIYRGKDLLRDLKHLSWMQLYLFGITGRHFTAPQVRLFEAMWILCTSFPDPRLWNNRIGSLAASQRSTATLALGAAITVSEATIYGGRPIIRAISFLIKAKKLIEDGDDLETIVAHQLKTHRHIPGYGRPIVSRDERIGALYDLAKGLGLAAGPLCALAFDVEKVLLEGRWRMRMNAAALAAGLAADQGLSEQEFYLFLAPCFTAGIIPCYIDASERPEGSFLPVPCKNIKYLGRAPRKW